MGDPLRFPAPPAGGPARRGPLGGLAQDLKALPSGLRIAEVPFPGLLLLRGSADDAAFAGAVARVLDVAPADGVQSGEGCHLLRLEADTWLAVLPSGREETVHRSLAAALDGLAAAVIDVSDAHAVLDLSGPLAREVLAGGCPLDLHPRALPPGHCARTTLAGVAVVVQSLDGGALRLFVAPSVMRWCVAWLLDHAAGH